MTGWHARQSREGQSISAPESDRVRTAAFASAGSVGSLQSTIPAWIRSIHRTKVSRRQRNWSQNRLLHGVSGTHLGWRFARLTGLMAVRSEKLPQSDAA